MSAQQLFSFQKPQVRETRSKIRIHSSLRTVDRIRWTRSTMKAGSAFSYVKPRINADQASQPVAIA